MARKLTTEEFIEQARKVHGDKYDYSKVEYKSSGEKVTIICPKHGEFYQTPYHHLVRKQGCRKCKFNLWTTKTIIEAFRRKYGEKYDYSKVEYNGFHTKVCIICHKKDVFGNEHGEFYSTPANFLNGKQCPKCKNDKLREVFSLDKNKFVEKAIKKHGNKYDYSKVEYINNTTSICIICPIHGEFWQTPANHLNGNGCRYCSCEKTHDEQRKTTEQFIEEAKKVHGEKYNYSKVKYINHCKNVCIICPTHGEFWQSPISHLNGRGCRLCNESHLEAEVFNKLGKNSLLHEREKRLEWLGRQSLDFYLPQYNISIECQGIQHFRPMSFFDKNDSFERRRTRDNIKKQLCEEHGIKLFYFSHEPYDEFLGEKVYHDIDELIEKIKNG